MSDETFISKLANHIQSRYDLTCEELVVVFPNKRAAFYLRNEFKEKYQKTIWLPQMLSIQEAVMQWSGITLVDTIDMLFELLEIDAQMHIEQNSELSVFGSQATQMAKDFDEIDQYGIDAKSLFNYVVDNKKMEIWNFDESKSKEKEKKYLHFFTSLYEYYLRLKAKLSEKGQGYYGMITRHLAQLTDEELSSCLGERKVVFAGFNALTTTEAILIDKLIRIGKAEILFDYDRYYVDDVNNEAGFFARRYLKSHPNWLTDGITDKLSSEKKHIHIVNACGNVLQAKALQSNLGVNNDKNAAIVLADENLLIPVLNAIPATDAYHDFKVSMGYPIKNTPVNELIKLYFHLHKHKKLSRNVTENGIERHVEGWYIWPILKVMNSELMKILFSRDEFAVFSQWRNERVNHGKFIFENKDIDDLLQAPDLQRFLSLFLNTNSSSDAFSALQDISQLLLFISNKLQVNSDKEHYLFLLNQVSEIGKIINRIERITQQHHGYVSDIQSLEVLYQLISSNTTIKLNCSSTEGLQIMGLLETRNIDFIDLHVLSVNEGILPTDKSQGSFIPHYIKTVFGLPGYAEKQAVFAYHFYRLLQNGRHIYLYFNSLQGVFGGEASRYILQIRHELAKNPNITIHEEQFEVEAPAIDVKALSMPKKGLEERLKLHLQKNGLSPTTLSTYISCPLKFYLKTVEGLNDNSLEERIGADIIGNIIHGTLKSLFEDYLPKDGKEQLIDKELFDKAIYPQWEQKLQQAIEENMPWGFSDVGFNYLNNITIKQQLNNYLKYTSQQLNNSSLVFLKIEEELRTLITMPWGGCLIKGTTDRIDRWGDSVRVIDYKSGTVINKDLSVPVYHEGIDTLEYLKSIPEKALQLLLYKYLYLKTNPNEDPSRVKAAIHSLKRQNNIEFELSFAKPVNKTQDAPTYFLDDVSFIQDMETLIKSVVNEIMDAEVPFAQTSDEKKCRNCDFIQICKRSAKGFN